MAFETYNAAFYKSISNSSFSSAKHILAMVMKNCKVESILDVGCGVASWLKGYAELTGSDDYIGVDGAYVNEKQLLIPANKFRKVDLKQPLDLKRQFDLVISMEVAEHIEEPFADTFIDSLVCHSDKILFSAALPGQDGTYHVNEQFPEYWAEKFAKRGYVCIDFIRDEIWNDRSVEVWYRQNTLFFVKESNLALYPTLQALSKEKATSKLTRINPDLWVEKTSILKSWRYFLRYKSYHLSKVVKSLLQKA